MPQFDLTNFNRFILDTENDADSPDNEELMQQMMYNLVGLLILMLDTGVSGAADNNPPNDNTGVLTDAVPGFVANAHDGRTLLITSGIAKGLFYTIDITGVATLACTGDNLFADGVRTADTYKILYDLKANLDGHDHDDVNSKLVVGVADGAISQAKLKTAVGNVNGNLVAGASVYVTEHAYTLLHNPYMDSAGGSGFLTAHDVNNADQIARVGLYNSDLGNARAYDIDWRYIQASDEPFVYALRDNEGRIVHLWTGSDPPPGYEGLSEKPEGFIPPVTIIDKEGKDLRNQYEEIVIFKYSQEALDELQERRVKDGKHTFEILNESFDYDEGKKLFTPKNLTQI